MGHSGGQVSTTSPAASRPVSPFELATLSHDPRASVAALRLLVEAVHDGVIDAQAGSSHAEQMVMHGRMVSMLVARLDELAGGAQRSAEQDEVTGLVALVEHWGRAMAHRAEARRVELRTKLAPGLPEIRCRVSDMSRVLLNLLDNAIRHAGPGGSVTLRALPHRAGVQVHIENTGDPLHAGLLDDNAPGGLGLGIVRAIVEAHGGHLWAAPAPQGASVRFRVPLDGHAVSAGQPG